MRANIPLTIASLLSILLFTVHFTDDIILGFSPGTRLNLIGILLLLIWTYGTIELAGKASGYIIALLFGLSAFAMPVLHFGGRGVAEGSRVAEYAGEFRFIWTLWGLGIAGAFAVILSAAALWRLRRTGMR